MVRETPAETARETGLNAWIAAHCAMKQGRWALETGGANEPGVLWCGTIPGGLFRSNDNGTSWVNGSAADNTLVGADNRYDIITGYDGNDTMTGGVGADQFWYNGTGWGDDTITDFQLGLDQIDLRGVAGAHPLTLSTVQSGADTVISYTSGATTSTITLQGVLATSLVPHDILV